MMLSIFLTTAWAVFCLAIYKCWEENVIQSKDPEHLNEWVNATQPMIFPAVMIACFVLIAIWS
jgi:hypothetical protein